MNECGVVNLQKEEIMSDNDLLQIGIVSDEDRRYAILQPNHNICAFGFIPDISDHKSTYTYVGPLLVDSSCGGVLCSEFVALPYFPDYKSHSIISRTPIFRFNPY